jgi:hypothetical protein
MLAINLILHSKFDSVLRNHPATMSGNYPKFSEDKTAQKKRADPSFTFCKRVYYYRIKNEPIYLR